MLVIRIVWLLILSLLFVAILGAAIGPWSLLVLVALVVYAVTQAGARQRHLAKLAQDAADA